MKLYRFRPQRGNILWPTPRVANQYPIAPRPGLERVSELYPEHPKELVIVVIRKYSSLDQRVFWFQVFQNLLGRRKIIIYIHIYFP